MKNNILNVLIAAVMIMGSSMIKLRAMENAVDNVEESADDITLSQLIKDDTIKVYANTILLHDQRLCDLEGLSQMSVIYEGRQVNLSVVAP